VEACEPGGAPLDPTGRKRVFDHPQGT
jgi:hypothetical protein